MNYHFIHRCLRAYRQYFKSQSKLLSIMFLMFAGGLSLMNVSHPILLAFGISLVDALPLLGSGIIFIPWIIICLLQGQLTLTVALFTLWLTSFILRQVMENYLLGKDFAVPFYLPIFLVILCSLVFNVFAWLAIPLLLPLVAVLYHWLKDQKTY